MSPPRIVLVLASLGLLGHAVGVGAFTTPLCFTALVVYALRAILGGV